MPAAPISVVSFLGPRGAIGYRSLRRRENSRLLLSDDPGGSSAFWPASPRHLGRRYGTGRGPARPRMRTGVTSGHAWLDRWPDPGARACATRREGSSAFWPVNPRHSATGRRRTGRRARSTCSGQRSHESERRPPAYELPANAHARVLLDKTGESGRRSRTPPGSRAASSPSSTTGGYLNDFFRSLKAWTRGRELAARLKAARSMWWLGDFLLGLDGRRAPYRGAWGGHGLGLPRASHPRRPGYR